MSTLLIDKVKVLRPDTKKLSANEKFIVSFLKRMNKGAVKISLPNCASFTAGDENERAVAEINITDDEFFNKVKLYGDIGFGEAYVQGYWETSNIVDVISWALLNFDNMPGLSGSKASKLAWNSFQFVNKFINRRKANTKKGSQKNISYHYDLSNDFYRLWLDDSMTYSSAYYETQEKSLFDAQQLKYQKLTEKLQLSSGDKVLEIGCGWGGMAIYMASNFDVHVTGITISKEQFDYATKQVEIAGLGEKIDIVFKDYRNLKGQYDKIVSIEMIEAVGDQYYKSYFKKIHQVLKPNGIVAIQTITSPDSRYKELKSNVDWIQKHIFPGSLLPSIAILNKNVNATGDLHLVGLEEMGLHYAKTLNQWSQNFNKKINEVKSLGFNDEFIRKWNYYLSYCEAAFEMRNINVVQMVYSKPNNQRLK
ncbi:cyclopropane-fatty-acyl-phospholipid synthase family protein [Cyclobacteriaceae bacterium]|nr:cyclopropane-fatty-acyl-phospholipid synthase family protein [Cyclobacteriaceae bacterium]